MNFLNQVYIFCSILAFCIELDDSNLIVYPFCWKLDEASNWFKFSSSLEENSQIYPVTSFDDLINTYKIVGYCGNAPLGDQRIINLYNQKITKIIHGVDTFWNNNQFIFRATLTQLNNEKKIESSRVITLTEDKKKNFEENLLIFSNKIKTHILKWSASEIIPQDIRKKILQQDPTSIVTLTSLLKNRCPNCVDYLSLDSISLTLLCSAYFLNGNILKCEEIAREFAAENDPIWLKIDQEKKYKQGMGLLSNQVYEKAKAQFLQIKKYKNADSLFNICCLNLEGTKFIAESDENWKFWQEYLGKVWQKVLSNSNLSKKETQTNKNLKVLTLNVPDGYENLKNSDLDKNIFLDHITTVDCHSWKNDSMVIGLVLGLIKLQSMPTNNLKLIIVNEKYEAPIPPDWINRLQKHIKVIYK